MNDHSDKPLSEAAAFRKEGEPAHPDVQNPDAPATAPPDQHEGNQPKAILSRSARRQRDRQKALLKDALGADRKLKRGHRAYWKADPKGFRALVAQAHSRVFHMKSGPPPDPLVSRTAREVALGAHVEDVFKRDFPHRRPGDEDLYAMAVENFRGKVNTYIRKHPRLKRLRDRPVRSAAQLVQPDSAQD